eukprot:SAG31_NODE_2944_length_4874_cov_30.998953_8_plen_102_part_00
MDAAVTIDLDAIAEREERNCAVRGQNGLGVVGPWRHNLERFDVRSGRRVGDREHHLAVGLPVTQCAAQPWATAHVSRHGIQLCEQINIITNPTNQISIWML